MGRISKKVKIIKQPFKNHVSTEFERNAGSKRLKFIPQSMIGALK